MASLRPDDIDLFALYHLGLDATGVYRFRNLAECARHLSVPVGQLQGWLQQAGIDADSVKAVPFNVTQCHVDAQFVTPELAAPLVRAAWSGFQQARRQARHGEFHHDVNYDDIWGDGHQGDM